MPTKHTLPECDHGEIHLLTRGNIRCAKCNEYGAPGDTMRERNRNIRILRGMMARYHVMGALDAENAMKAAIREIEKGETPTGRLPVHRLDRYRRNGE